MERISDRIKKLELSYSDEVVLKLRLQLEDAKNSQWTVNKLTEHLLSEDFGLDSDELDDIRDVQHEIITFFGED